MPGASRQDLQGLDQAAVDREVRAGDVAGSVAGQRVKKGPDHHEDVWWSCVQKVDHVVVIVEGGLRECREEVLESKKRC